MELKIELDSNAYNEDIGKMLNNLSEDQRTKVASNVAKDWVENISKSERSVIIREIHNEYQEKFNISVPLSEFEQYFRDDRLDLKSYIKDGPSYSNRKFIETKIEQKTSLRNEFYNQLVKDSLEEVKKEIKEKILDSPEFTKVKEDLIKHFIDNFPVYTQRAMSAWFIDNMQSLAHQMNDTSFLVGNLSQEMESIKSNMTVFDQ